MQVRDLGLSREMYTTSRHLKNFAGPNPAFVYSGRCLPWRTITQPVTKFCVASPATVILNGGLYMARNNCDAVRP
jgi:hypothetical protein